MDIVARELGLYNRAPCYAVEDAAQLPKTGRYFLLVRAEQLLQLSARLGNVEQVGKGLLGGAQDRYLPRLLRLAKGEERWKTYASYKSRE